MTVPLRAGHVFQIRDAIWGVYSPDPRPRWGENGWMATGSGARRQFFAYPHSDRSQSVGYVTPAELSKPDSALRNDLAGRQ